MATLTITIPDNQINRVAAAYGYQEFIKDIDTGQLVPNPETRGQYLKRVFVSGVKTTVRQYEETVAADTARSTVTEVNAT